MVSAVRRLLDELSWEGNARRYRDGGLGLENVVTTEVFQALDFLPRQAFLGRVLAVRQVPRWCWRRPTSSRPWSTSYPGT